MVGERTIWERLAQCVALLDKPFRASEIIGWFRRHHPEVNEASVRRPDSTHHEGWSRPVGQVPRRVARGSHPGGDRIQGCGSTPRERVAQAERVDPDGRT